MEIYLIRHGETVANKEGVYYGRTDLALTEEGIKQCQQLIPLVEQLDFDRIIISSLKRTRQSADVLLNGTHYDLTQWPMFDELDFGQWEGRHYRELMENDNEHYAAWCNDWINVSPPGGENFRQFVERIDYKLKQLLSSGDKKVLIVGHQGVFRIILMLLLKMPEQAIWHFCFEHGTYSLLELTDGHTVIKKINATQ